MEQQELKPGIWWFDSKSDPRWNCAGTTEHIPSMRELHPEAKEALESIKEQLGEDPPEDLVYTATRD